MVVLDASVAVRWFVSQPGHEAAVAWLRRSIDNPSLLIVPDLFHFEVYGALCRLQRSEGAGWVERCLSRLARLGLRTVPSTKVDVMRGAALSRDLMLGGYDALYLAHAERLGVRWLTADVRALRRLAGDPRVLAL